MPGASLRLEGSCEKLDLDLDSYDALASATKSPEILLSADRFARVWPCWYTTDVILDDAWRSSSWTTLMSSPWWPKRIARECRNVCHPIDLGDTCLGRRLPNMIFQR